MGALKSGAATLLAGLAATAGAGSGPAIAAPGFLGRGHDPGVAVDRAGTAHVAWLAEAPGGSGSLEYCQVPRGMRACALRRSLPLSEDGFGKVQVLLPRPRTVLIVAPLLRARGAGELVRRRAAPSPSGRSGRTRPRSSRRSTGRASTSRSSRAAGRPRSGASTPTAAVRRTCRCGSAPPPRASTRRSPRSARAMRRSSPGCAMRSVLWNGLGDPNLPESWVEGPRLARDQTTPAAVGGRSGHVGGVRQPARLALPDRRAPAALERALRARDRVSRDDPLSSPSPRVRAATWRCVWGTASTTAMIVRSRNGRRWRGRGGCSAATSPQDLRAALGRRGGWMVWDANPGNAGMHPIRIAALPRAPRR